MAAGAEQKVAILFADIVGSTQLYESLGDEAASDAVQSCLKIMRQATESYGGTVVKTVGDEVMSVFPSADDALNAANEMQQRITNVMRVGQARIPVSIRIGCHYGSVVAEERDIFGAAVHTANRMTSQAKAGQVLTTAALVEELTPQWRSLARQIDVATPRGQSDEVAVFEVLWQPDEATSMHPAVDPAAVADTRSGRLRLRFRGEEVVVGEAGRPTITMGRADENDIVVKGNLISRIHARVDCAKRRFVLVDESTNGTFIQRDGGEEIYVRRDSAELTGSGIISLGRVAARGTPLAIEFSVEE
ncbi:MAG: FHA domain-containing protein [Chromatiales bacterium]|nr:FHA domain-containing protein [Chromatiales bacterium]